MLQPTPNKPPTYTAALKRVEALADHALQERLNRSAQLLCETTTMRDPAQRELAQQRVLRAIEGTQAALKKHRARSRFSSGS